MSAVVPPAEAEATQATLDICFSPSGTAWIRNPTAGAAFYQLLTVPSFTVTNVSPSSTGLTRTVFVPPNGVARLQL